MNGKQTTVLWLGISLIIVRLFATGQWGSVWSVIGGGGSNGGSSTPIPSPVPALHKAQTQIQQGVKQGTQVPIAGGVAQHG